MLYAAMCTRAKPRMAHGESAGHGAASQRHPLYICRFAAIGVLITGLFILPLAFKPPVDTVFLFGARALETGAFACLYVWTPEVSMQQMPWRVFRQASCHILPVEHLDEGLAGMHSSERIVILLHRNATLKSLDVALTCHVTQCVTCKAGEGQHLRLEGKRSISFSKHTLYASCRDGHC